MSKTSQDYVTMRLTPYTLSILSWATMVSTNREHDRITAANLAADHATAAEARAEIAELAAVGRMLDAAMSGQRLSRAA